MTHAARVGFLLALASLLQAACGRGGQEPPRDPAVDVTWTLQPATPVVGPGRLTLAVASRTGTPIAGATVKVEGQMTHPGMAPVLADAVERAPGVYEADYTLTMAGDWVLLVSVELPDGSRVERRIDLANVRPSG